jgi:MtN3 and saliva related transmembrane protein
MARDFYTAGRVSSVFDNHTEIVGLSAGICTSVSLLPQLLKLLRHKKADDISLFYLVILFVGLGLWIWYGILREDIPIVVTNGFSLVINGIIIVAGIRYKRNNSETKNGKREGLDAPEADRHK